MKKSISELNYSELLNYANSNSLSDSEKDEVVDSLINFRKYSEYNVYFLTITWLNTNQREKLINSLLENCSEKVIYNFSVSLGNKLYESEVNYIFDKIYEFNDEDYVFMYIKEFFNVLKGDMSLIGPRPERPFYVEKFKDEIPKYMVKHQVRPGITGWAQVNGWRGDTSIEKRIECDIYYIENWSLALDIKIVFMTLYKGFINTNAY